MISREREEAIKRLEEARFTVQPYLYMNEAFDVAIEALSTERPKGRWVEGRMFANREEPYHEKVNSFLYCSNCECEAYWDTDYGQQTFDFCPNCGADMRGVEE